MSADVMANRDAKLTALAAHARLLVIGREVIGLEALPHIPECDAENVIRLHLSDGTVVDFIGGYGGYSGHSCDEYVELIDVKPVIPT